MTHLLLAVLLFLILFLPFFVHAIEKEIEYFLFCAGLLGMTISSAWNMHVVHEALTEPIKITAAVLAAGMLFKLLKGWIGKLVNKLAKINTGIFIFFMVLITGLLSSVITAIIAALLLSELITHIRLPKEKEIKIVVLACFSIGFGAALTPIGEPLSTIVISKLRGEPYNAGFFFMMEHFKFHILTGILISSVMAAMAAGKITGSSDSLREDAEENIKSILLRTFKVYIFVAGLVLVGTGFKPLVDKYISVLPHYAIYWINSLSAVLDNATLAAAEITPSMSILQIKSAVLGLIIAGGMLIPGNIPNIISANKLGISSKAWAKTGLPYGFVLMAAYFIVVMIS